MCALDVREARWHLWRATGDRTHLEEAKRLLDAALESAPEDSRDALANEVALHRDILAAWHADHGNATTHSEEQ